MSVSRRHRLLVPDNTPISLLSMLGEDALNWLFEVGAEVWITDMVVEEAVRDPGPGADPRHEQRLCIRRWLKANMNRLRIQETEEGADYRREMRNWERGGSVQEDRPRWRHRGERSISEIIPIVAEMVADGEAVVLLVDDKAARALLIAAVQAGSLDADIMATQTFLRLLEDDFGLVKASNAWEMVKIASDNAAPKQYVPDPILVRKPRGQFGS